MNTRIQQFSATGPDGKEHVIFSIENEIPSTCGVYDLPEYRLDSPLGPRLNMRGDTYELPDGTLTLTRE